MACGFAENCLARHRYKILHVEERSMKAVRVHEFGGPEVLKYEEMPRPEPGEGEVLVKVCAVGVNPVDWKIRAGRIPRYTFPIVLGRDLSGIVEAGGPGADRFHKGDEVYGLADTSRQGAYAEYTVVKDGAISLKPQSLDFEQAAAVPLAALVAWQTLFDIADLSAGQTVLIQGAAGGIGHYAVQLAKWKGANVIGTVIREEDVDFARELGADEVIDVTKVGFDEVVCQVDVVLDLIGGDTQQRSWQVLKKGGILVSTVGIQHPEEAEKHGVRAVAYGTRDNSEELAEIAGLIDSGVVRPAVQTVLPLEEAAKAHEMLEKGEVQGKVVLRVNC